jgi:hypothetical protein
MGLPDQDMLGSKRLEKRNCTCDETAGLTDAHELRSSEILAAKTTVELS